MLKKFAKFFGGLVVISLLAAGCSDTESKEKPEKRETKVIEEVEVEETKEIEVDEEELAAEREIAREERYMRFLKENTTAFGKSFKRFGNLFANPTYTEDWIINVAANIVEIQMLAEEGLSYTDVPDSFKLADDKYKEALVIYKDVMERLPKYIDSFDSDGIARATADLKTANGKLEDSLSLFKQSGAI